MYACVCSTRLLARLGVAAHELIYAAGGINELALTGVEGVGAAGDFEFYYGVGLAFKLNGVVGLCCGAAEEHIAITHVLEDHRAIVVGMNTFFHCFVLGCAGLVYRR